MDDDGQSDDDPSDFHREILERDIIYDSLGHVHRRYLCYLLCERTELGMDEAVTAIADWETPDNDQQVSTRDNIRLSLLHTHIPKLSENDVVDFDAYSGTLVPADNADQVLSALKAIGTESRPESSSTDGD